MTWLVKLGTYDMKLVMPCIVNGSANYVYSQLNFG